jgi:alkaline phosphatase
MDADRVLDEVLEFDRAVGVAQHFAESERDTLVLVLADHECSGFSLIGALAGGIANAQSLPADNTVLDPNAHPARQALVGTYDLASFPKYTILADGYPASFDIDGKLLVGYGASGDRWETWLQKPLTIIDSLLPDDIKGELGGKGYPVDPADRAGDRAAGFFLRGQAVGHTQAVHTASDIPVSAFGVSRAVHRQFVGVQTNTDVFFKVARALLGGY